LYFTFLGVQDKGREIDQWNQIKKTATETILDNGGVLSHHHGIGYDHKQWLERDQGALGIEVFKNIKSTLDPENLMNPGKVF
jgi:alkyldihydroxyacetonephosphate synthase